MAKVGLFVCLTLLWLGLSGHYQPLVLFLGLVSIALTIWIDHRMYGKDRILAPLDPLRSIAYFGWLLREIVISAWDVSKRIIRTPLEISPRIVRVKASQHSALGRTIYANSITLTPGTISMQLDGDEIEVHALTREGAEALRTGDMDRRVTQIEAN